MTSIDDAVFHIVARDNTSALALSSIFDQNWGFNELETSQIANQSYSSALAHPLCFDTNFNKARNSDDVVSNPNAGLEVFASFASGWTRGTGASKLGNSKAMNFDAHQQDSSDDELAASPAHQGGQPRTRKNKKPVYWTEEEHAQFVFFMNRYNGDNKTGLGFGVAEKVAAALKTRTVSQVRSHSQKYFAEHKKQSQTAF